MEINIHFERKDPANDMSEIVYRALDIKTKLSPKGIAKVIFEFTSPVSHNYSILSVENGITTFRVGLNEAAWSSFARFLYEIKNHEGSSALCN